MHQFLLASLVLLVVSPPGPTKAVKPALRRTSIPKIARFLGIRIGYNGQAALERFMGPGERSIGGHPNGRESWRTRSPKGVISTDGFSMNDDGLIVEDLSWSIGRAERPDRKAPLARALPRRCGWMGIVNLGATQAEVEILTRKVLPPPKKEGDTWTWTATGFLRPKVPQLQDPYHLWTATLTFRNKRLVEIQVSCE